MKGGGVVPVLLSDFASMSTSRLRLQKMMPFVSASPSEPMRRRRMSRLSLSVVSLLPGACLTTNWSTDGLRDSGLSCNFHADGIGEKFRVSRVISGAMVAEKNSVWRVKGTNLKMRSMSG